MGSETTQANLKEEVTPTSETNDIVPRRLASLDFVKGIAIIFIVACHSSAAWLDPNWKFLHGIVYAVLDVLGPSLFIFLSALSVVFSIERKKGKLPLKVVRNTIFSRALMMITIGALFNLVLGLAAPFPFNMWGWNIIMFIGFSQIFSYYALKIQRSARIIIGIIIIFASEILRETIFIYKNSNPAFGIIFSIVDSLERTVTLIPWISICFITSVFGEYLYKAMMDGSEKAYRDLCKLFLLWGTILTLLGILTGISLINPSGLDGALYKFDILIVANQNPVFRTIYPGIFKFLIRGTFPNMWYNIGTSLLIVGCGFYLTDIKRKDNIFISMARFYGKASLNIFLAHYVMLPILMSMFSMLFYPFFVIALLTILGFLFFILDRYGNNVGTPEWLMAKILSGKKGKKS